MKENKTSFPITVEIFEGAIDFGVDGAVYNLVKGDLISLEASISHYLVAKVDSIVRFLLKYTSTPLNDQIPLVLHYKCFNFIANYLILHIAIK